MPKEYRFYKTQLNLWFIDLPEWKGSLAELQMVAGADTLLDELSGGSKEVLLEVSLTAKKGFEVLEKVEVKPGGGADYKLKGQNNLQDKSVWLCDVTEFVFNNFPEKIFFRKRERN